MSRRPRLADLFCKAGGAARGYWLAGFDVVGVDIEPQPNYPYEFHQADAMEYPLDGFDVVHASPPCQGYSTKTMNQSRHPRLIAPVREMLERNGVPYVIENVEGARSEMVDPIRLCGSSFGLGVRRHRYFESNLPLEPLPCDHKAQVPQYDLYDHGRWYKSGVVHVFGTGGGKGKEHWPEAMGIDWMTNAELVEAIPPAYTEYLGEQVIEMLADQEARRCACARPAATSDSART